MEGSVAAASMRPHSTVWHSKIQETPPDQPGAICFSPDRENMSVAYFVPAQFRPRSKNQKHGRNCRPPALFSRRTCRVVRSLVWRALFRRSSNIPQDPVRKIPSDAWHRSFLCVRVVLVLLLKSCEKPPLPLANYSELQLHTKNMPLFSYPHQREGNIHTAQPLEFCAHYAGRPGGSAVLTSKIWTVFILSGAKTRSMTAEKATSCEKTHH